MNCKQTPRRIASLIVLLGAIAATCGAASAPEDELKAAVVLSFLRYTQVTSPQAPGKPIRVCVAGRAEFADILRHTIEGKLVDTHPVAVEEVKSFGGSIPGCGLVYVATGHRQQIQAALSAMGAPGALTMGESDHFLELGGAVNLDLEDGRVTFQVDLDSLEHAGVSISAKLLRFGQLRGKGKARAQ